MTTYGYLRTSRAQEPGTRAATLRPSASNSSALASTHATSILTSALPGPLAWAAGTSGTP